MDVAVNFVNAPLIAKERGIEIVESKIKEAKEFTNLISVKITSAQGDREVGGAVLGGITARLVSIDGFRVDLEPAGYLLILSNIDKPGMIGKVGNLLGQHQINIASMDVGRVKIGEKAVMVLSVDCAVPDKTLKELATLDGIFGATLVKL